MKLWRVYKICCMHRFIILQPHLRQAEVNSYIQIPNLKDWADHLQPALVLSFQLKLKLNCSGLVCSSWTRGLLIIYKIMPWTMARCCKISPTSCSHSRAGSEATWETALPHTVQKAHCNQELESISGSSILKIE